MLADIHLNQVIILKLLFHIFTHSQVEHLQILQKILDKTSY